MIVYQHTAVNITDATATALSLHLISKRENNTTFDAL
jgi:hypothetical protein